jgi:hypothetical protein
VECARCEDHRRDGGLHVAGAQAVQTTFTYLGYERIGAPLSPSGANRFRVDVAVQHQRAAAPRSGDAGDEVRPAGISSDHAALAKPALGQVLAQERDDTTLIGIRGNLAVDPNEVDNEPGQLVPMLGQVRVRGEGGINCGAAHAIGEEQEIVRFIARMFVLRDTIQPARPQPRKGLLMWVPILFALRALNIDQRDGNRG